MRVFFATDLHGSMTCFKKFLAAKRFYKADILILGGDLTGKGIVPLVGDENRATYTLYGRQLECRGKAGIEQAYATIQNVGFYPLLVSRADAELLRNPTALDEEFARRIEGQIAEWDSLAALGAHRIWVIPGNDDAPALDCAFEKASSFINCERQVMDLPEGWRILGLGGSNATPWNTYRELSEDEIRRVLDSLMSTVEEPERCVWNVHVPPANSGLDICESIDERYRVVTRLGESQKSAVGSSSVAAAIREWQPALALFGHIHESRGWLRIGSTVCANPGSEYPTGWLNGCLVDIGEAGVENIQLTSG